MFMGYRYMEPTSGFYHLQQVELYGDGMNCSVGIKFSLMVFKIGKPL